MGHKYTVKAGGLLHGEIEVNAATIELGYAGAAERYLDMVNPTYVDLTVDSIEVSHVGAPTPRIFEVVVVLREV